MAGVLLASILGYLIDDQFVEHEHFDRASVALDITRHRTSELSRSLAELRHDVAVLTAQVGSDSASWNQDGAQLKAAAAALAITQADVSQQSSRIGPLHTCLGGVQRSLNALAINNQMSAVAELDSVESSCARAPGG
jgi:hypothetical protein